MPGEVTDADRIDAGAHRPAVAAEGRDRRWVAYGALVLAISGIAWSAIFIRWSAVPGPSSAFYRVSIAALILVPWTIVRLASSNRTRRGVAGTRRAFLLALLGGLFFGLDLALYNTAVMRTTATTATLLGNNAPVFVGLGTWLLFKRPPPRRYWIGLGFALTGAAIVMVATASRTAGKPGDLMGAAMALAAAVFFAAYLLAIERVREEMDTLMLSTIAIVGSVCTLLVLCVIVGAPLSGFSVPTWSALLALGLISQLGAYLALTYALGHLPATVTSVGLLAQVPLTAILAVPLLGEPLTTPYLAGGFLVLTGIAIVNSGSK
jgi:drug/metabolite transporter (DMT)-like permease